MLSLVSHDVKNKINEVKNKTNPSVYDVNSISCLQSKFHNLGHLRSLTDVNCPSFL